jgi:hypothetical protein
VNQDTDWMPYVGNVSSILGLLLSLILNIVYLNGSIISIFFLSPILLFLNEVTTRISKFEDELYLLIGSKFDAWNIRKTQILSNDCIYICISIFCFILQVTFGQYPY